MNFLYRDTKKYSWIFLNNYRELISELRSELEKEIEGQIIDKRKLRELLYKIEVPNHYQFQYNIFHDRSDNDALFYQKNMKVVFFNLFPLSFLFLLISGVQIDKLKQSFLLNIIIIFMLVFAITVFFIALIIFADCYKKRMKYIKKSIFKYSKTPF